MTLQVEAIKNLKIDKIKVWDSCKDERQGTTTANFLSGLVKSLPPLHDIAEMAGLERPKYLGDMNVKEKAPHPEDKAEREERPRKALSSGSSRAIYVKK